MEHAKLTTTDWFLKIKKQLVIDKTSFEPVFVVTLEVPVSFSNKKVDELTELQKAVRLVLEHADFPTE